MTDRDEKLNGVSKQAEQRMTEADVIENDRRKTLTGGGAPYDRHDAEDSDRREADPKNVPAIKQDKNDDQNKLVDQTDHQNRP